MAEAATGGALLSLIAQGDTSSRRNLCFCHAYYRLYLHVATRYRT